MCEWKETDIGKIPNEWDLKTVDEIKSPEKKSIISGPFGSNISAKYFVEAGVPVIRGNNLSLNINRKFNDSGFVFITEEKAIELGTWAEKNDIIFTAVGTIGQVGILMGKENFPKYIISNKQLRLKVNEEIIEPLYAYYWFASPMMVDIILQRNTGSSVPLINLSVLKSLLIPIPPKNERVKILSIITSIDDKIDLIHRQNITLEAMAETLFRQWFVEEAKEEWGETNLFDSIELIGGGTPKTENAEYWDGNIKWLSCGDISANHKNFVVRTEKSITELDYKIVRQNCYQNFQRSFQQEEQSANIACFQSQWPTANRIMELSRSLKDVTFLLIC
jgi:type I restriction enzyme S subunit